MKDWLLKKYSFKNDLFISFINGLVVMGGVIFLNGLIARLHGLEVLGEFLLVKRTLFTSVSLFLIGSNLGLANYISKNDDRSYGDAVIHLFFIFSIPLIIVCVYSFQWLQIDGIETNVILPYILFAVGICIQTLVFSLFRGYLNMIGAGIVQLLGTVIIPIVLFLMLDDLLAILFWIGSSSLVSMFIIYFWRNNGFRIFKIKLEYYKNLIIYGFNRVPSFISQFILLAGIPIMIAKTSSFENVAYYNSSLSLLRLSLIIINPIGMVFLPRISKKFAKGEIEKISMGLQLTLLGGLFFSIISGIWIFIFAPSILELWLGQIDTTGSWILRGIIISFPFYTIAGLARSPIDAASQKGYNSIIYGTAAIFVIISYYFGIKLGYHPLYVAVFSFVGGQIIAGVYSLTILKKIFNTQLWNSILTRDLITVSFIEIIVSIILLNTTLPKLGAAVAILILGGISFYLYYKYSQAGWVREIRKFNS